MRKHCWPFLAAALLLVASCVVASADEWPQWRGPNRDGVWNEQGLIEKFPAPQLKVSWRAPISSGYSGPTVADGRVYVMDRVDMPKQIERVLAFDAKTGEELWKHAYDCVYSGVQYVAGPRASVSIDDGRAFSLGTMGHLFALDAASGTILWQKDLLKDYKIRMPIWGIAASPLVTGDLVIVQIGGEDGACLVAFDKRSGTEKWRALDDDASYSAPIIIQQAGRRVLVCWTGDNVAGLDPASGKVYWQHPFEISRMVISIATPVVDRDRLFVSSFYDGSLMLKLASDATAVEPLWRRRGPDEQNTDSLHSIISTPFCKAITSTAWTATASCAASTPGPAIASGKAPTRSQGNAGHDPHGPQRRADLDVQRARRGDYRRLSPQGFQEISRAKLIDPTTEQLRRGDGVCWSHPAYAYKHVFARNDKELVCASLAAE